MHRPQPPSPSLYRLYRLPDGLQTLSGRFEEQSLAPVANRTHGRPALFPIQTTPSRLLRKQRPLIFAGIRRSGDDTGALGFHTSV